MQIQLKNIGMIKEANVKIDGLTVIAGENSTGKSTVGKLLFAIIKSSSRYNEDLEEKKEDRIISLVRENYFAVREEVDFSENREYQQLFSSHSFSRDIRRNGEVAIDERLAFIKDSSLSKIEKNLQEIKNLLLEDSNIEEAQERAFKKALVSEFKGQISTQNDLGEMTSIKIIEGKNKVLDIELLNDKVQNFNLLDELSFSDATFIETPIVIQLAKAIDSSKTYFEESNLDDRMRSMSRPDVPLHIKDLDTKIKLSTDIADLFDESENIQKILENIYSIIDGEFKYNRKERDFQYISKDGKSFPSLNTATGMKAFGVIQLLLQNAIINKDFLLILDEPEVHLHPKWQLKYAEIIVKLVENNINVLVTSHSPYMIEALKRHSDKEKLQHKTNFYLAENGYIEDKNKLQEIYEKLSEPFDEFDKMDSDILNGI